VFEGDHYIMIQINLPPGLLLFLVMSNSDEIEDILYDSLEFLGGKPVTDHDTVQYGPLKLSIARKVCRCI
jgi:hypothetical protein